ncbi:LPXTG cell wall anchor domain-containing protein [uncultured Enterococcus sp.]|uniref:LPXTG cell wall anchor domain-containing protein n=1 Tax=uncultured Enterococcus sp. TaxID=167972 RepID=UPI002AA814E8|nr:LPXTG cell wall anchor domain-containing protein [uncultured Enterococcus sp.]
MKKKIYGVLVVLCCPILLNAQHVFAEEGQAEQVDTAAVEEIMAEALMTVPEAVTAPSGEPMMEESATEDSTTMDSSTEVTEETTNSEPSVTEESTTDTSVVEEVPTVDSSTEESVVETPVEVPGEAAELPVEEEVLEEEVSAEALSVDEEDSMRAAEAVMVTLTITYKVNGTVVRTDQLTGEDGEAHFVHLKWATDYVISSISDERYSVLQTNDMEVTGIMVTGFPTIQGYCSADLTELTVELIPRTTVGVHFNLRDTSGWHILGGYDLPIIYKTDSNEYSFTPPQIEFYDYVGPEVITGTFDDSGIVAIDLPYYQRIKVNLTLLYLDEYGNSLGSENFTGAWDMRYRIRPAKFSNRKLLTMDGEPVEDPDNIDWVVFPNHDFTITFVYSGIPNVPGEEDSLLTPGNGGIPQKGGEIQPVGQEQMVPLKTIQPIENNKKVLLPETGEESNIITVMAGTVLFLQAGYMMLKKKNELES